jgi:hypothetical protein
MVVRLQIMKAVVTSSSGLAQTAAELAQNPTTLHKVKRATRQIRAGQVMDLDGLRDFYEQKRMSAGLVVGSISQEEPAEVFQAFD